MNSKTNIGIDTADNNKAIELTWEETVQIEHGRLRPTIATWFPRDSDEYRAAFVAGMGIFDDRKARAMKIHRLDNPNHDIGGLLPVVLEMKEAS